MILIIMLVVKRTGATTKGGIPASGGFGEDELGEGSKNTNVGTDAILDDDNRDGTGAWTIK